MIAPPPVLSEAHLTLPELVPYYLMPPCPFTKAQAVRFIVNDRLIGGMARGKGSNARKRAENALYESLKGKRASRGWLTFGEATQKMGLERQKQLNAETSHPYVL